MSSPTLDDDPSPSLPPKKRAAKRRIVDDSEEEENAAHDDNMLITITQDEKNDEVARPSTPTRSATAAASSAIDLSFSPPVVSTHKRLRRAADVNTTAAAASSSSSSSRATQAVALSPLQTRKRLRKRSQVDEEEEEEAAAEEEEEQEEEEEEEVSVPVVRPSRRAASSASRGLSASHAEAISKFAAERAKALAAKDSAAAANGKKKRLFQDREEEEGNNSAAAAAASSSSSSSSAAVDPSLLRSAKYARAEQIIHADSEIDEESEGGAEEQNMRDDKYFSRIKAAYDPLKEERELERVEKEEARRKAKEKEQADQIREEKFKLFQEREAKKKNSRIGKGTATKKTGAAAAPRRRKKAGDSDEENRRDDDDGFVVNDDEIEYYEADENTKKKKKKRRGEESSGNEEEEEEDDDEEGEDDEFSHARFDEQMFMEEEKNASAQLLEAAMTAAEAFNVWCRYLCGCLIDTGYSNVVDRDNRLRMKLFQAQKIVEEQFNSRREQWVRSATWDGSHAAGVLERMTSLAYSMSEASMSTEGCEVCRPRKGHPHQATHQLSYFGVCYDPAKLTHPFKKDEIILSDHYEQHQFNVGQLCHQRLKLYHVMKHFKLHVMLSLKAHLKILSQEKYGTPHPPTRLACFDLMDYMCGAELIQQRSAIKLQYSLWEQLNDFALSYSTQDARKVHVDLEALDSFQDFDREECLLDLFDWRPIDSSSKFDSRSLILSRESARDRTQSAALEAKRKRGVSKGEEDEYEVDEEAEKEAEEAERQVKSKFKKLQNEGVYADQEKATEEDDDLVLIETNQKNGAVNVNGRAKNTPAAAASSSSSSNTAAVSSSSSSSTLSGWVKKRPVNPSAAPPSSAETIDSDDASDSDHTASAAAAIPSSTPTNGWKQRKGAAPLSLSLSSPSSAHQQRTPPTSGSKLLAPASKSADGESTAQQLLALNEEERINFCVAYASSPAFSHKEGIQLFKSSSETVKQAIKQWIKDNEEHL